MTKPNINFQNIIPSRYDRLVDIGMKSGDTAVLYSRDRAGGVHEEEVPFQPWILTSDTHLAEALPGVREVRSLNGKNDFSTLSVVRDVQAFKEAQKYLKSQTGRNPTDSRAPYHFVNDFEQQLLSMLPARLFRNMTFEDVRRMQIDIETYTTPGFDFPNAEREEDEIIMIAMRDNTGWEMCLAGPEMNEKELLQAMIKSVHERDPDIIEGHNVFDFDLSYIYTRCRRYGIPLALGRDGSVVKMRSSRLTAGEQVFTYKRFDIFGRHVVDTMHLVRLYDITFRGLQSYGLKAVAQHFHVAAENRTYVDGASISDVFDRDPERLKAYSMDDVRETDAISAILSPSYFYQTQMVPFSYQNCVTRGNASRIEALLVGEYIRHGESIPKPAPSRRFSGGLTDSLATGVFKNVWHADIRSLYPSIIISHDIKPKKDSLNIFTPLLAELRSLRLQTKDSARNEALSEEEREHHEALQTSLKIVINSFYGYLGFARGSFNDFDAAEQVTQTGREILQSMMDHLRGRGAQIIEVDTDGLYFVPPEDAVSPEQTERDIQQILPQGIDVDLDETYAAMFGYKSKNYALLGSDNEITITGAALKSRGLEKFQRDYIKELVRLLLTDRADKVKELTDRYSEAIRNHELPLSDLAKRETLSTPPHVYKEKLGQGKTKRSAAYELVLASGREYKQGDQVAFYITGDKKNVTVTEAAKLLQDAPANERDENVPYYLDKLEKLRKKFEAFLPAEN